MYAWILGVFFTVFFKNRNISSKIKRSKVTDYAALKRRLTNDQHLYIVMTVTLILYSFKPLLPLMYVSQGMN